MTAYTVTAGNAAFYMTLLVEAPTAEAAAEKFSDYIADQQYQEEEEYESYLQSIEGRELGRHDFKLERGDFSYEFEADFIEEFDGLNSTKPTADVQVIGSGGNG